MSTPSFPPKKPNRPPPPPPDLHRKVNSDYIMISQCHTGHQKSRSLTDNIGSSYICLDLNIPDLSSSSRSSSKNPTPPTTVYKEVDFLKTDALNKCKVERTQKHRKHLSHSFS